LLEFRILGPCEVVRDGDPLRLGGPKQRAVLAMLLLEANRVVSIDRLAEDLYSDARPASAVTQIHARISQLRKLLDPEAPVATGGSLLETRAPGYVIKLSSDQVDLHRFERWTKAAAEAHAGGEYETAASRVADALALWRGPALADLAYESFAQTVIARLEDMRLAALEQQMDAWLALGRDADAVSTLEALIAAHPFRERLQAQLMLALYRSGRQAEALDAYRKARAALIEHFGIEPTPALRELQQAILNQAPALAPGSGISPRAGVTPPPGRARTVVLAASDAAGVDSLLAIAEPLGSFSRRELVVTRLLADEAELRPVWGEVNRRRATVPVTTRAAVFTSVEPGADLVRLAAAQDAELVIVDAQFGLGVEGHVSRHLAFVLEHASADVAVLAGAVDFAGGDGVFVPFGGGPHAWAALELAALMASGARVPLTLVGTSADPDRGQRDASRLLAAGSLAVERVVGIRTEPLLIEPTANALVDAVASATVVVVGGSSRWRLEGVGSTRWALIRDGRAPAVVVHRGPRPGGLAPLESLTRFTWTIEG
jgi:DNA-binding SARP family transcriptional activator